MAWEEESIEGGADFEEVSGKKSPVKLIIMIVAVILVLGGGYFAYTKFFASEPETEETAEKNADEPVPEDDTPEDEIGFKVDLEKFTLNLAGGTGSHFLVTSLSLEVTTQELKDDILDVEDKKLYMIKTRNKILDILRKKTFKEINDPDATRVIAKEILFQLNKIYKSGKVRNVYFSDIMVQ